LVIDIPLGLNGLCHNFRIYTDATLYKVNIVMSVDSAKPLWIEYIHIGNEFVVVERSILHNIKI
jgi:hypothetical protein